MVWPEKKNEMAMKLNRTRPHSRLRRIFSRSHRPRHVNGGEDDQEHSDTDDGDDDDGNDRARPHPRLRWMGGSLAGLTNQNRPLAV